MSLLFAGLIGLAPGTTPASAAGISIAWNNCRGDGGLQNRNFACNTNTGQSEAFVSFVLPSDIPNVLGIWAEIEIRGGTTGIPEWWDETCRNVFHATPTSGFNCFDPFSGIGVVAISSYQIGYYGPNTARLVVIGAVPAPSAQELFASTEYTPFKIIVFHASPYRSCAGCSEGLCITLRNVHVDQVGGTGTVFTTPWDWNTITWQTADADGDGYGPCSSLGQDCDDTNPATHLGDTEVVGNGIDDNCDNRVDEPAAGTGVTFTVGSQYLTGFNPYSVAIGDVNGDLKPDLAMANYGEGVGSKVSIVLGDGAGGFGPKTDWSTGTGPVAAAIQDLNADGRPDLVTSNYAANTVSVRLGLSGYDFGPIYTLAAGTRPYYLAVGDLNGDGKPDLAVPNQSSSNVSVLLNHTGAGASWPTFAAAANFGTVSGAFSVAIGDLNADGRPDLAVRGSGMVSVLLASGALGNFGTKTDFATGTSPYGCVAIGDVNADGKPDVVAANSGESSVSVLINTTTGGAGTPTFAPHTTFAVGSFPLGLAMADVNGDSKLDLSVTNGYSNTVSVLLGDGTGGFGARTDYATGSEPFSVAIGDLNADGRPDLAVANSDLGSVSVLLGSAAPGFAAVGDLNADSRADLAVANSDLGSGSVLLGSAAPGFAAVSELATGTNPYEVAMGDVNGDRKPDLAVANYASNAVSMMLGTGGGSFGAKTDFATGAGPVSVAIGDVSGDGKPDLAVANNSANTVSVLLGNGTGGFGAKTDFATGAAPYHLAIADVNGDGRSDLAVPNYADNTLSVLLGIGNGTFGAKTDFPTGVNPISLVIRDVSGDGKPDLAVANRASSTVSVLPGNGAGGFGARTDFATGNGPYAVAIGDLDADGKPDLVAANYGGNSVSVLLGDGVGGFSSRTDFGTREGPFAVAVGDLTGDGKPELAVASRTSNTLSVLVGDGNGAFGGRSDFRVGSEPFWLAMGDLNGDGRQDLAAANYTSSSVSVLLNAGTFPPVAVEPGPERLPRVFELFAPRPNPTRGTVEFAFALPGAGRVLAEVFDLSGRRVARLSNDDVFPAGHHSLSWDGRRSAGGRVVSGVYLLRLRSAGFSASRKVVMVTP